MSVLKQFSELVVGEYFIPANTPVSLSLLMHKRSDSMFKVVNPLAEIDHLLPFKPNGWVFVIIDPEAQLNYFEQVNQLKGKLVCQ